MNKRNSRLRLSVILNLFLRIINLVINLMIVPILLLFLGKDKYGIWVTIFALVNWINMFDIGLGQGLKIELTKAFSLFKVKEIKRLISTSYFFITFISIIILLIFILSQFILNWSELLNVIDNYKLETQYSINILTIFVIFIFTIKLIGVIYSSLQLSFVDNLIKTISQLIFLIALIIFINFKVDSSLILVSLFSIVPLFFIYLLINIYFFKFKSQFLAPKVKEISKKTLKKIINPSLSFFIIQIGSIVLYSTDNIIILKLLSASEVTDYSIYYKYYSIPFVFFNLFISSHWPSFIDALAKNDYNWIKNKIIYFNKLFMLLIVSYIFLFFYNVNIIKFWIGNENIKTDKILGLFMILYFLISSYTTIYIYVINAYGKLRVQLISYIIIAIINIPLSVFLVKYFNLGSAGVILASLLSLTILMILIPIQYHKIINKKINGVWNK